MSELLRELLIKHEGKRLLPYDDRTGARFESGDTLVGQLTIGVGRNLSQVGLTEDEVMLLLNNDIERVRCELNQALPWWIKLGEVREAVLLSLGFNLGVLTPKDSAKFLSFKTTLGLLENGKYAEAADRLMTLPWAQQVGPRAVELCNMLRTGKWRVE